MNANRRSKMSELIDKGSSTKNAYNNTKGIVGFRRPKSSVLSKYRDTKVKNSSVNIDLGAMASFLKVKEG